MVTPAQKFKASIDKKKVVSVSKTSLKTTTIATLRKKDRLNNITVPVSVSLKQRLEEVAIDINVSRAEFMRAALEFALNNEGFIKAVKEQ